jgi:phosphatidylglycerol:prolipoprotein diacylglycerol transferase
MFALGFYVANLVITRLAKIRNLPSQKITDLVFWGFLVGILGARVLYILTQWSYFLDHPLEIVEYWTGGFVFLGGFLCVIPFIYWYGKKNKLPLASTLDVCTIGLTIAHAIGRIGCFATGCCYGKPTNSIFGVTFSKSDVIDPALRFVPVHPTQLYESACLFVLFGVLIYVFKTAKKPGSVAFTYLFTYPIIRIAIEQLRGDLIRGFIFGGLSTSQFLSLLVFFTGIGLFIWDRKDSLLKTPLKTSAAKKA